MSNTWNEYQKLVLQGLADLRDASRGANEAVQKNCVSIAEVKVMVKALTDKVDNNNKQVQRNTRSLNKIKGIAVGAGFAGGLVLDLLLRLI